MTPAAKRSVARFKHLQHRGLIELTGDGVEGHLSLLCSTADETNVDDGVGVLGGSANRGLPLDGVGRAGGENLVLEGLGDGVEVRVLREGSGGQGHESSKSEAHRDCERYAAGE